MLHIRWVNIYEQQDTYECQYLITPPVAAVIYHVLVGMLSVQFSTIAGTDTTIGASSLRCNKFRIPFFALYSKFRCKFTQIRSDSGVWIFQPQRDTKTVICEEFLNVWYYVLSCMNYSPLVEPFSWTEQPEVPLSLQYHHHLHHPH